ncbi:tyrosine-type recombinase/integrase [Desulfovibrio sp.]|uniref:tyrosine-type recombinase/integrase n=1 Tax=Desulfovibrio sp. TaxID=885 RepID=UPI00345C30DF
MPQKLTDAAIRTAKPRQKPYKLADGGGLYVEVAPGGGKWWRLKYRFEGKEKRISLGVYPAVSLKEARLRALAAKAQLSRGIDPSVERRAAKAETVAASMTFEKVAREWHAKQIGKWTPRHAGNVLRRLEVHAFPDLGVRPIADLGAPDFLAMLHKVEDAGHMETARRSSLRTGDPLRPSCRHRRRRRGKRIDGSSHCPAGAAFRHHHGAGENRLSAACHRRIPGRTVHLLRPADSPLRLRAVKRAARRDMGRGRP